VLWAHHIAAKFALCVLKDTLFRHSSRMTNALRLFKLTGVLDGGTLPVILRNFLPAT
jgi:hypothetical protein